MTKQDDKFNKNPFRREYSVGEIILICVGGFIIGTLAHSLFVGLNEPTEIYIDFGEELDLELRMLDCKLGCADFAVFLKYDQDTNGLDDLYISDSMYNCTTYCEERYNESQS